MAHLTQPSIALRKVRSSMPSSFCTKSPKQDAMAAASRRLRPHWTTPLTGPRKLTSPMAGYRVLPPASRILMPKLVVFNQRTSSSSPADQGMGKTSLAANIAFNVASAYDATQQVDGALKPVAGGIVAFFSLEMSSEQLATRVISEQTEIPSSDIRRGEIDETDFGKLLDCRQQMRRLPLFIDQTGAVSIAQLAARARRQRGLHLIIVDYIQLMQGKSPRAAQNRVQEITEITTGLKALAKELSVPIIALSQLSRGVESRDEKRPQLSDLRESGSIEQDADVVLFVFREEYYLKNKEPKPGTDELLAWESEMSDARRKAEVIIAKQRHGPTGTVAMTFQGEFTRFFDLAERSHLPHQSTHVPTLAARSRLAS